MNFTDNDYRPNSLSASRPAQSASPSRQEPTATPLPNLPPTTSNSPRHRSPGQPSLGRDELNLVDFPIGALTYQQPRDSAGNKVDELVFSVDAFEENVGTVVPKKVTIRTSSRHGFPTPKEEELLVGLMLFCQQRNNFTQAKVEFRVSELLRVLGWADNGRSRRQLREGLDRLAGVKLKFENSWQSEEGRAYEREFVTGILDGYDLNAVRDGEKPGKREFTSVQWSAEVFADIQRGNVKELNTNEYFALQRPLSRRMYRFLDKHLVAGRTFDMNLLKFAAHLGISETHHIGKIRERLKVPLRDLESLGTLIEPATDADRYHRLGAGEWLIRFERTESGHVSATTTSVEAKPRPQRSSSAPKRNPAATELVQQFYEQWCGNPRHDPSFPEIKQAQATIDQYGHAEALALLPVVVKLMKDRFPNATSFGATKTYWHLAKQHVEARKLSRVKQQQRQTDVQHDDERRQRDQERRRQLQAEWNRLDESQQYDIRRQVLQSCTDFVRHKIERREFDDSLLMIECLKHLDKG